MDSLKPFLSLTAEGCPAFSRFLFFAAFYFLHTHTLCTFFCYCALLHWKEERKGRGEKVYLLFVGIISDHVIGLLSCVLKAPPKTSLTYKRFHSIVNFNIISNPPLIFFLTFWLCQPLKSCFFFFPTIALGKVSTVKSYNLKFPPSL